jgi:hypothetical protein
MGGGEIWVETKFHPGPGRAHSGSDFNPVCELSSVEQQDRDKATAWALLWLVVGLILGLIFDKGGTDD